MKTLRVHSICSFRNGNFKITLLDKKHQQMSKRGQRSRLSRGNKIGVEKKENKASVIANIHLVRCPSLVSTPLLACHENLNCWRKQLDEGKTFSWEENVAVLGALDLSRVCCINTDSCRVHGTTENKSEPKRGRLTMTFATTFFLFCPNQSTTSFHICNDYTDPIQGEM